jgi:uncharacterized repeat protein (TIGR02543 family)
MIVKQNEYAVIFSNMTEKVVMADSMKTVTVNYETPLVPISQLRLVRANVESILVDPSNPVNFTVLVTPAPALAAGCIGTPNAYTVEDGTEVIFQAVPAVGFTFDGWYLGLTKVAATTVAKLPVNAPAISGQTVQFEAKFVAVP